MTFKAYLRQQDPKRHPRVYIEKSDCEQFLYGGDIPNCRHVIVLKVHGALYTYFLSKDSPILWTIDEDGNPKSRSCFVFKE